MNNRVLKKLNFIIITFILVMGANLYTVFANNTNITTNTVTNIKETGKFDISKSKITIKSVKLDENDFVSVNYENGKSCILSPDQNIEIFQSDPNVSTNNTILLECVGTRENPINLNLKNINIKTNTDDIPLHVTNNSYVRISLYDNSINKLEVTSKKIPALMIDASSSAAIKSNIENSSNIKISGVSEAICNFGKLNLDCQADIKSGKSNSSAGICNESGELYVENAKLNISSHIYGIYNYYGHLSLSNNSYVNIKAHNGIFNVGSRLNFCDATLDIFRSGVGIYNIDNSIFNMYSGKIDISAYGESAIENIRSISNINGGILNCEAYGSDINSSGIYLKQHSKLNIFDGEVYCRSSQSGINAKTSSQINVEGGYLCSEGSVLGYGIKLSKDSSFIKKNNCNVYISGYLGRIYK